MIIFGDPNEAFGHAEMWAAACASLLVVLLGMGLITWVARVLRVAAGPALWVLAGQVVIAGFVLLVIGPFFMASDGLVYDREAFGFSESVAGRGEAELTAGKEGWPVVLGLIYSAIGRAPFVGILVNCVVTALSSVFVAKTAVCIFGAVSDKRLLAAYFLSPLILIFGPSLMREALCWLGTAMLCAGLAMVLRRNRFGIATAVVGLVILATVRTSLGVVIIGAVALVGVVIACWMRGMRLTAFALVGATAVGAVVAAAPVLAALGIQEDDLRDNRVFLADATTGFPVGDLGSGPVGLLTTAFSMIPRIVFGPFPWELGPQIVWLWVLSNTVFWLGILWLVAKQVRRMSDKAPAYALIAASAIVMLGLSLTLTNYGIVVRMRGMPTMMLLPLVVGTIGSPAAAAQKMFGRTRARAERREARSAERLVGAGVGGAAALRGAAAGGTVRRGASVPLMGRGTAAGAGAPAELRGSPPAGRGSSPKKEAPQPAEAGTFSWAEAAESMYAAGTPMITGAAAVGKRLAVDLGVWGPAVLDFAYQWHRDGAPIPEATSPTYVLAPADAGTVVTVVITGQALHHDPVVATSRPRRVGRQLTATPAPRISGAAAVGRRLTAVPGRWEPRPVTVVYRWYRGGKLIPGATSKTYRVAAVDAGKAISVRVTGSKPGYTSVAQASGAVVVERALRPRPPKIYGTAAAGRTLTAVVEPWGPGAVTLSFQWYRAGARIAGATDETYTVTPADQGLSLTVQVEGRKPGYTPVRRRSAARRVAGVALESGD